METISIVRGNDFRLRIPIKRHVIQPDGSVAEEEFAVDDTKVLKVFLEGSDYHVIELSWKKDEEYDSSIVCDVDGLIPLGTYHLIVAGKRSDDAKFRSKERRQLRIVDNNERANIWPSQYDGFNAYALDTIIILDCRGRDGLSAYEIAILNGYSGTETEWLKSLAIQSIVKTGTDDLTDEYTISYSNGARSIFHVVNGESAYHTAVRLGKFVGTEEEWAAYAKWPELNEALNQYLYALEEGKVDDIKVNGDSVVSVENDKKVANIIGITSASAEADNEVGEPSVTPTIVDGDLHFEFHNIKGQKGDALKFTDLNPSQKAELKGEPGDSVFVNPGDVILANSLGDSDEKAITQQAVTNAINNVERKVVYEIYNFTANTYWNWNTGANGGSANSYARTSIIPITDIVGTLKIVTTRTSYNSLYLVVYNSATTASGSTFLGSIDLNAADITSFDKQYILDRYPNAMGVAISLKATSGNTSLDANTVSTQWHLKRIDSLTGRVDNAESAIATNASDITTINGNITTINGELDDQDTRIGNLKKDVDGFAISGFVANKMRQTSNGNYSGLAGAQGHAISPVLNLADNLGILQMINVGSRNAAWLSVYSNVLENYNSEGTHLGYININDTTFDPKALVENKGWTTAKSAILTIRKNTSATALDADVVATWQLKRVDSLRTRLDTLEVKLDDMKERKGVFVYDTEHNSISYVQSDLADNKTIKSTFRIDRVGSSTNNPCFSFSSVQITNKSSGAMTEYIVGDDNGPAKWSDSYLGGNHGDSHIHNITCVGHGKTFEDIGSKWKIGNITVTIVYITDENHVMVLPEPSSNVEYPKWSFSPNIGAGSTGTYKHVSGAIHQDDMEVTAVGIENQWRQAMVVNDLKVYVDGKDVTGQVGVYDFAKLEICETYDVLNSASILRKIQEGVNTFEANPVLTELGADKVARFSFVYTYVGADLWFINYTLTFYQDIASFDLVNIAQQKVLSATANMYVPKLLPFYGADYRTIVSNFAITGADKAVTSEYWENPQLPPDRWVQYTGGIGLASGMLFDVGIGGEKRKDYVDQAFVFSSAAKTYLHMADSKMRPVMAGDSFSGIAYRRYFDPSKIHQDGVICCNVFEYDNKCYIYADYYAAGLYEIDIPEKFFGKDVEVFEKRNNVKLLTTVSSAKLLVKVEEDEVMYGYLVAQIK